MPCKRCHTGVNGIQVIKLFHSLCVPMSVQDGISHVLKSLYTANGGISISTINVTDGMFVMNGTTSVPKSILCLVLDKVRQV